MKRIVTILLYLFFLNSCLYSQNVCVGDITLNGPVSVSTTTIAINWSLASGTVNGYIIHIYNGSTATSLPDINLAVTTSYTITGLSTGNSYQITVEGYKNVCLGAGGAREASFSNMLAVITTPSPPVALSATNITGISFTANWQTAIGASSYQLDVSSSNLFSTILSNYNSLVVNGTSQTVSGLSTNTTYYYRVRAVNSDGGTSTNSNVITAITILAAPIASLPSSISTLAFVANWQGVTGASNYRLDVSADNFATLLAGFNNLIVSGTAQSVSGLNAGTLYSYRIRAVNASSTSENSTTMNAKTLSLAPTAQAASAVSTSSFTANWSSSFGADGYRLDVSSDNFATMLVGYNDLTVNGTAQSVTGLNAGTAYSYRVRAVNASGASANSAAISLVTVASAPTAIAASANSTTGFTANWQATTGAASYKLDISPDNFATFLAGYNNLAVTDIAQIVSGLNPGTAYKYRVRAVNASGTSINSNSIDAKTISIAPSQPGASAVGVNSFTINWNTVTGAESYQLDVSIDNAFSTFITGYNSKNINGLTEPLTGLDAGTTYYFRVRTVNAGGISVNSLPSSQLTFPDAPQGFDTSNSLATSIKLNWLVVKSASEYQLQVSTSSSFDPLVAGYEAKVISPGSTTNFVVTGLASSTIYYFRMAAKNATGTSSFSVTQSASTAPSDGNIPPITFASLQSPGVHLAGQLQEISISITGYQTKTVSFYHKKNTESSFTKESVTSTTDTYKVTLSDDWFDKFGMEFYFEAKDLGNPVKRDVTHSVLTGVSNFTIPIEGFGKDLKNYQIISFPYALAKTRIEDILIPVMKSAYNKTQWRFVQYQNGENVDFQDGLGATDIAQGQGYWFISKSPVDLSFADGKTYGNSVDKPFVLRLKKGWNQIGNPFPYSLSWQDVINANSSLTIDKLLIFDKTTLNFVESDVLKVFGGGFVFTDNAMDITLPVTLPNKGGRKETILADNLGGNDWGLSIQLVQGEITNSLSGIGMRSGALVGKDRFDKVTPPRFLRYVEMNSKKSNDEFALSTDVVNQVDSYKWVFTIESNSGEGIELKWNKDVAASLGAELILYDQTKQVLVNMAKVDVYSTLSGANVTIHYRKSSQLEAAQIELGKPYPNPFTNEMTIPYTYSMDESSKVEFTVSDLTGRVITQKVISNTSNQSGIQILQWNGTTQSGFEVEPGIYLYRIRVSKGMETLNFIGKSIKQ